jgi:hypothetical protein
LTDNLVAAFKAATFFDTRFSYVSIPRCSIPVFITLPKIYIMADQVPQNNQLNIEISEEVAEGSYANLAIITHSHAEFVIDFVNVMPGTPKSKVTHHSYAATCQAFNESFDG